MKRKRISALAAWCALIFAGVVQTHAQAAGQVPLCQGLTIVTSVSHAGGDYESINVIESVSPTEVRLRYSTEMKSSDIFSTAAPVLKTVNLNRTMLVEDLKTGTDYQQVYIGKSDEKIPGTTSIGTSTAVLERLKSKAPLDSPTHSPISRSPPIAASIPTTALRTSTREAQGDANA